MRILNKTYFILTIFLSFCYVNVFAQQPTVNARVDATQITIGDQIKLFIEATQNAKQERLQWATIPDTFNTLEIVERGKIDTSVNGDLTTYKQRLLITGFDSGSFKIPPMMFSVIPNSGNAYTIQTDSFLINVSTLPVDTSKGFKGIKDIIAVKGSWKDYIWLIIGGLILIGLIAFVIIYFVRNKKTAIPVGLPKKPLETPQEKALRLLSSLEAQQLWQADRVKEYYTSLTDILRDYIEDRFKTHAMETTTDELLQIAKRHPEMNNYYEQLANILYTADLAKFAKAKPLPQEHTNAMELTKQFVMATKPTPIISQQKQS